MVTLNAPPAAAGAMDGERIYVPLQSGHIVALARETGEEVWTTAVESRWPPLTGQDTLVVASSDAIHGVDARTGEERWMTPMDSLSAPLMADADRVIAATESSQAASLRTDTGAVVWRRAIGATTRHPAAAVSGLLVFTLDSGHVLALKRDTGEVAWQRTLEGTLSAPAAARDRILVGSTTNSFYALDAQTGDEEWKWRAGGDVIGAAAEGDVVYFASLDNILRAVNRYNGNQRWKTVIPMRPAAPPIAFGGIVVLAGVAPRVDAVVGKTGATQGSHTVPADLEGVPLIDRLFKPYQVAMVTITRDGRVTALRPEKMMMREPAPIPLTELPGRRLGRERLLNRGS